MTRAFISHSWADKPLARRIAYRLSHRGVPVWIDETQMQVGDRISEKLQAEIRNSTHLVVLVTARAAASRWVRQEVEVAAQSDPRIPILPLIAEADVESDVLKGTLGVDVADPLTFEDRMDAVAGAILGGPCSDVRDPAALRRDLDAIARQEPDLKGLIVQLADEGRITHAQLGSLSLTEPLRHPAETALIALHERADPDARYVISLVAARFYCEAGVGYPVLRRQILLEPSNSGHVGTMFNHLGDRLKRPIDLDGAFRLFTVAEPPHDQAFADFVRNNFDQFAGRHRDMAVKFVVTPDRGPARFGIDAAYELFSRMPDVEPLKTLWYFWVNDYKFGGKDDVEAACRPSVFFARMNQAIEHGLSQFDSVMDHFEASYRSLCKTGRRNDLDHAIELLHTAARANYGRSAGLARQLAQGIFSAEWSDAEKQRIPVVEIRGFADAIEKGQDYMPALKALRDADSRSET